MEHDFINKITEIIEENLSNEKFGVSELAGEIGMSRSNLLRKIKKTTKLSASQFIRQVRLQNAMALLKQTSANVSEVSFKVGFGSTSYFIKCFHDHYGYPPGEVGKRVSDESEPTQKGQSSKKNRLIIYGTSLLLAVFAAVLLIIVKPFLSKQKDLEKSIAVLPFKNDSNDSTNIYLINGLMESLLDNLQKIEDLRVISRTSVEKYRNIPKSIPEIARELDVNYFIEGSGQKIGDQILLSIQLIEAQSDKHLWAELYNREVKDIFALQMEIAQSIADEIQVIITPEEEERINKAPTDDPVAYDYFLRGLDRFYERSREGLEEAIALYKKAIEHDPEFARAHAGIAIAYYFLDIFQAEKQYSNEISSHADKALLYDPKLPQSLIAKAVFYMNNGENELAVPYLEKALEYNPNSALVINILSDFYTNYIPNTKKYLEYALRGVRLDIAAQDSTTASFIYLHLSNALVQSGFVDEAVKYINQSLIYDPDNLYSAYVKAFVLFARDRNLEQTKELLIEAHNRDTTRLDILQEVAKICYYMRDYESAYHYYTRFIKLKEAQNLDLYRYENDKIGFVFSMMGQEEEADKYFSDFLDYSANDKSIYKHLNIAMLSAHLGDTENALEQLALFSQQNDYDYWILVTVIMDPLIDNIKDLPEFKKTFRDIESKFWNSHREIKASLGEKDLL